MRTIPLALLALLVGLTGGANGAAAAGTATGEVVDRTALRVCADPANMPFSDEAGEGFENKIADLFAKRMGLPLAYTWYPASMGFIRQTLRARLCDVVIGVVATDELTQNTNPYYHSTYVMAVRHADRAALGDLDSPAMEDARIGVVAGTPPADLLARRRLLRQVVPYQLQHDTRVENPLKEMADDLEAGRIDVALGWGPALGYWAKQSKAPLDVIPLHSGDPRVRLDFRISMGIRQGEPDWKHALNRLIAELQPQITAILQDYGVPLVGQAAAAAAAAPPALPAVPEPEGYRMDAYRSAVPATLKGATVLDAPALARLIEEDDPVLVDVLPKQRRPEGGNPDMPWMAKKRLHIPHSTWLPNTGYGELSAEFAAYFKDNLDRLTKGDHARPVVFYCDANCWMSWNAAKRAMNELGYTHVYWYPKGAQGWEAAGHALEAAKEVPMPGFIK
ncbi:MAG: quinoprotein dehydrogenase-associated putative ABC transporter substrate-binding protein [Geminicoccaceae bacterium]|nr:quinoprotein dehydrogenase-associated putative ABC transporter substrate-binding protein [Geminicoccaceae bacterium]